MTKHVFTTFEVCEILNIKLDRLRDYTKRGFFSPSVQKACGAGTKSLFDRADIVRIKTFLCLIELGFSRKISAKVIDLIKIDFDT
jgi:DNA-binding transcriptional MerR regulator